VLLYNGSGTCTCKEALLESQFVIWMQMKLQAIKMHKSAMERLAVKRGIGRCGEGSANKTA
jgi:hypothetical protein